MEAADDGRRDAVGVTRRGTPPDGHLVLRVKIGPNTIKTVRSSLHWYGSVWQGTAQLDDRRGREIVVGYTMGAHAQFYGCSPGATAG
jgi:hypothetical protein